ncbi:Bug family tripartite tricarboxylate transporter substrate binding protein [Pseudonocardia xinjiangensis]|uniref:Tripartite tricarboxylate transporter substrate binding protein n=1 Tax=Pseudonocardia xinjiangensis TaxID=75289 RepID=A0ABX1RD88_9PSEU|nr:tripartite tricarboxylate transporter substrate-binding protein [Pseudonocardia xinjiangensis]NMH78346.1 tripartite tricarboxylate transporter substrate binding protein [Pseudonocardia xinjiangensis]
MERRRSTAAADDQGEPGAGRAGPRRRWYRFAPLAVAAVVTGAVVVTAPVDTAGSGGSALRDVIGERQLRIMAPAAPGGGWDQTSREMQGALRELVGRTEVYNVAGAGGTIGLSQFVRRTADPTELMTTGLIMVGAVEANGSPHSLADTTPLVRLTTDYQVVVVAAGSPLTDVAGLVSAMRADIAAVSISGGSAGGAEQILAGLLAKAVGADPAKVSYVAHSGGGEALTTLLSGRSTIGVSGVSELQSQIEAGTVRALAVSSPERLPGLPDVPTLRESGVDVELQNWRGVVAPAGISPEQEQALEGLLVDMTRTDAWREALDRRGWGDATLAGPEFEEFVRTEQDRVSRVLDEIGLG